MSVQYVSVRKVPTSRVTRIIRETLKPCLILLMEIFKLFFFLVLDLESRKNKCIIERRSKSLLSLTRAQEIPEKFKI